MRLAGKVAFITGGGTGIGRACATLFAREGAQLALVGRRREPLEAVASEITSAGGSALPYPADVVQAQEVESAIQATIQRFGGLDVVVNNAGMLLAATAEQTSQEDWNRILAVNLTAVFLVSRTALPAMRKRGGGSIVNIGSVLGLVGMRQRAAYTAAKGGVTMLTKAMALDHAAEGIRVNCICPAIVETELVRQVLEATPDPEATRRSRIAQIPLGRLGQPEDVAQLALFLASDESSWLTGTAIPLDGGLTAY
jgi:NAD(P)-dependent dehydrogenase (short-subunit alcohol dehydrogenase family)